LGSSQTGAPKPQNPKTPKPQILIIISKMGNCCGEQEDKNTNVNIKDKKTGGKGVGADAY